MTADSLPLWNNPAGLIAGPQPDGFSSRGFNRLRQRLPRCNHCHSHVNPSSFFISFDLIILQRPIGLFKHWDLISEHRGNQASRPPRRDQTNSGAEPSRAEHLRRLCLPAASLSCRSRQWQLALKCILDLVYEFPACRADARLFCASLGLLSVSATSLLCVFQAPAQSQAGFWINTKPDATQTLWGKDFLQLRPRKGCGWHVFVIFLIAYCCRLFQRSTQS